MTTHKKDIVIGQARVCWGFAWHPFVEGWCLPGGGRTNDRAKAEAICAAMDEMMSYRL